MVALLLACMLIIFAFMFEATDAVECSWSCFSMASISNSIPALKPVPNEPEAAVAAFAICAAKAVVFVVRVVAAKVTLAI